MTASYEREPDWYPKMMQMARERIEAYVPTGGPHNPRAQYEVSTKQDLLDYARAIQAEPSVWDYMVDARSGKIQDSNTHPPNWLGPFQSYYMWTHKPHLWSGAGEVSSVLILMWEIASGAISDIESAEADALLERIIQQYQSA